MLLLGRGEADVTRLNPTIPATAWLTDGRLDEPGVWVSEQVVDGDMCFAELVERGMGTTLDRRERLY